MCSCLFSGEQVTVPKYISGSVRFRTLSKYYTDFFMSVCMKGSVVMAFSLCFRPRSSIAPGESHPLAFSFISVAVSQNGARTRTHTVPQTSLATILGCDMKGNNVRLDIIIIIIYFYWHSKV